MREVNYNGQIIQVIEKAKFCKKPVAGYDDETKRAYIEYSNGGEILWGMKENRCL